MSLETTIPAGDSFLPPVSAFTGPIAELVGHQLLSPPSRPGLMASLGNYEVLRVLGSGGMGVVVLARDSSNGKEVAVKLVRPELVSDQRMVHRFVKEAGHLQKLKHPNIVPVLEVSDRATGPYFVMPYFDQGSLAARIRPGQPLQTEEILDIALPLADGLGFAHRHGIIHRDLKPANILLGSQGKCCLADFGLARTMFNDTIVDVERNQMEGTAPYMSPGVAAGHAEDTRCDIYAFGALLYEMLTGEPPYAGRNTADICSQIVAHPPKPIQARNPVADASLTAVAEGAMARELRDRYADMADVLADLERIKTGKTVNGPHGISHRVKNMPFSWWIPGGIVMIGAGLLLLWPSSSEKTPIPQPAPPPAPHVVITPSVIKPSVRPMEPEPVTPATPPRQNTGPVFAFAGQSGNPGSADGPAASAQFRSPGGIAVDSSGNLFIADTGNNTIRKINRDGVVKTFAGEAGKAGRADGTAEAARFSAPLGIAVDAIGNIYVAEFATDTIRKISASGMVVTLAGSAGVPGSENGTGDNAHFRNPWSVGVDLTGNLFVADKSNFTIRQITPNGRVATFAGRAGTPGNADGVGGYARFGDPDSLAIDPSGTIFVADGGNNSIRKITPAGAVTTFAGKAANFSAVQSVAVANGHVYVVDGDAVRDITDPANITNLPESSLVDSSGRRIHPTNISIDGAGNFYLVESLNHVIWEVTPPASFRGEGLQRPESLR